MTINEVSSDKLKGDESRQTLWYKGKDGDLFIIFEEKLLVHFEVTVGNKHLEGGRAKNLKYGLVDNSKNLENIEDVLNFKKSRIIQFQSEIPKDFIDQSIEIVHQSEKLEVRMKEAIMEYLSSEGQNDTGFAVTEPFDSFREIIAPPFQWKDFFWGHRNKIILGTFILFVVFMSYRLFYLGDLKNSCEKGNDFACVQLGLSNKILGKKNTFTSIKKSEQNKIAETKSKCENGDMDACYSLQESNKDPHQLMDLHQKACLEKNHPKGCYYLGLKEWNEKNLEKGKKLLAISCEGGFKNACEVLKSEEEFGKNLTDCQASDYQACYLAGLKILRDGEVSNGLSFLKQACDHKVNKACLELGHHYVKVDNKSMARNYYFISCKLKSTKGCYHLKFIASPTILEKRKLLNLYRACKAGREEACLEVRSIPNQ